jgi:hypothetical protein
MSGKGISRPLTSAAVKRQSAYKRDGYQGGNGNHYCNDNHMGLENLTVTTASQIPL